MFIHHVIAKLWGTEGQTKRKAKAELNCGESGGSFPTDDITFTSEGAVQMTSQ